MGTPGNRTFLQRLRRLRVLWRETSTGADLGCVGPARSVDLDPPKNQYWIKERLRQAPSPEARRKAAHGYVLQTIKIAEHQAQSADDTELQGKIDRLRDWLAEQDLVAVSELEQAQQEGSYFVAKERMDDPSKLQENHDGYASTPAPVELDDLKKGKGA